MNTLYDLLGALPSDDAEELRTAFRRAVKGVHPDIHPDDPDAALKFREIVRANEILVDDEQRAAYDHLLDLAREEQKLMSRHAIAAKIHRFATGVIAVVAVSVVSLGGYLLFMHTSAASLFLANPYALAIHAKADIVAASPRAPADGSVASLFLANPYDLALYNRADIATASLRASADTSSESPSSAKPAILEASAEAVTPDTTEAVTPNTAEAVTPDAAEPEAGAENAPAAAENVLAAAENVPAINVVPAPDPRLLRAQGAFAYRNGDLTGALAALDHAIDLDPEFSAAYIDRGIVFYRLQKFERAYADISRAKRIEKAGRAKPVSTLAGKPRINRAGAAPPGPPGPPLPRRRVSVHSPHLLGWFASASH